MKRPRCFGKLSMTDVLTKSDKPLWHRLAHYLTARYASPCQPRPDLGQLIYSLRIYACFA